MHKQSRFIPPLPREHGAWAMLIVPLVTGMSAAKKFDSETLLLALCALGFFLLRSPLVLAMKTRAPEVRAWAFRWSAIYAMLTAAVGILLLLSTRLTVLVALGVVGGVMLLTFLALAARRAEMSLWGELLGIAGLALSAPAAYLVGTRELDWIALALYFLNVVYFGGTVVYIKFKVREQPRIVAASWIERLWAGRISIAYHVIAVTMIMLAVEVGWIPALVVAAFILSMCKVMGGVLNKPVRLNIKRLGLIEVGFTLAFLLIVVIAYW